MKNTLSGLLCACTLLAVGSGTAWADYDLRILHTNDVHDRIEPVTKYNNTCAPEDDAAGKCFGGYARLATAIRNSRAAGGNVLVVDGGDQFQGSLYYSTYKGSHIAELMNMVGYDAMAVGNHEFDDGPDVLAKFIRASRTPILSSNIETTVSDLHQLIKPETIVTIGGERIGIVGLTTPETAEISSSGPNVAFNDPATSLQRSVDRLTAQGINKIIALSHSGSYADFDYVGKVSGIDVIVGGHDHLLFSNSADRAAHPYPVVKNGADGSPVLIVQAYAYSRYLGNLSVTFDDNGKAVKWGGDPVALDASFAPANDVAALIDSKSAAVDTIRKLEVGQFTAPADGARETCRAQECSMGSLVADAMLWKAGPDYQIAIQNGGGVRASIDEGRVTMGEVMTVLPFQNALATFKLSGKDVVASLEHGVSLIAEAKGQFPQIAGLKFELDPNAPAGSRVSKVMVEEDGAFAPIDADRMYGVVSNDFMRNGGDGYALFRDNAVDAYDFGPNLEQAVADYIEQNSPMTPSTDGRIIVK